MVVQSYYQCNKSDGCLDKLPIPAVGAFGRHGCGLDWQKVRFVDCVPETVDYQMYREEVCRVEKVTGSSSFVVLLDSQFHKEGCVAENSQLSVAVQGY